MLDVKRSRDPGVLSRHGCLQGSQLILSSDYCLYRVSHVLHPLQTVLQFPLTSQKGLLVMKKFIKMEI